MPFYDRTQLIDETVDTLETALMHELWITVLVVLVFLLHLRSSLVVASTLPIAVLMSFIAMDVLGVDSNIMSLTGIAIAVGTMVDMGIVMTETIYAALVRDGGRRPVADVVEEAALEVAPALATAVATTILTFLPILFLTDVEGKLFRPLAWTKTFALAAAAITGMLVVPVFCRLLLTRAGARSSADSWRRGGWDAGHRSHRPCCSRGSRAARAGTGSSRGLRRCSPAVPHGGWCADSPGSVSLRSRATPSAESSTGSTNAACAGLLRTRAPS